MVTPISSKKNLLQTSSTPVREDTKWIGSLFCIRRRWVMPSVSLLYSQINVYKCCVNATPLDETRVSERRSNRFAMLTDAFAFVHVMHKQFFSMHRKEELNWTFRHRSWCGPVRRSHSDHSSMTPEILFSFILFLFSGHCITRHHCKAVRVWPSKRSTIND